MDSTLQLLSNAAVAGVRHTGTHELNDSYRQSARVFMLILFARKFSLHITWACSSASPQYPLLHPVLMHTLRNKIYLSLASSCASPYFELVTTRPVLSCLILSLPTFHSPYCTIFFNALIFSLHFFLLLALFPFSVLP